MNCKPLQTLHPCSSQARILGDELPYTPQDLLSRIEPASSRPCFLAGEVLYSATGALNRQETDILVWLDAVGGGESPLLVLTIAITKQQP